MGRDFLSLAAASAAGLVSAVASACPVCQTDTGEQVRAGIFDGHFVYHILVVLVPFPVFAAVVAAIYFGGPRRGPKRRGGGRPPVPDGGRPPGGHAFVETGFPHL